jgi:hypothetical protein
MIIRISIISYFLVLFGCSKTNTVCSDNEVFCNAVASQNFKEAGRIMNSFMSKLDPNLNDDQQIDQLNEWLRCKSCVVKIKGSCTSCLRTYPPTSVVIIDLNINGLITEKAIYVTMHKTPIGYFTE